jgi:hypothetical protein
MFGPVQLAMHGPTGEAFAVKVMSKAAVLARSQSKAVMEARATLQVCGRDCTTTLDTLEGRYPGG